MAALNQPTINSNYLPLLSLGSPLTSLRESAVSLQHAFVAADSVGLAMAQAVLAVSLGTAFLSAVFVGLFAHSLRLSALGQIILSPGYNLVTPLIGIVSFFALVQAALFAFLLYDERVSGAHVLSGHQDALCTRVVRWVGTVRSWRVRRKRAIVVPESQQDESTVIELVAPAPRRRDLDD
ncbi:uncharacterized protein JCM10292_002648 [Rhodotorula paludigena]|uniref:uncharacterized protein n=1 Tax=Rhodotorula paludigena TaxID=86838 RepID=UPI00317CC93C